MAVESTSLDDWRGLRRRWGHQVLTEAFAKDLAGGWAMTSLALVFVECPTCWKMSRTNWSSIRPRASHLICRLRDGLTLSYREEDRVGMAAANLMLRGPDEASIETFAADGEVLDRTLRRSAVIAPSGLRVPHRIAFEPTRWCRSLVGIAHILRGVRDPHSFDVVPPKDTPMQSLEAFL